ncbi:MAG: substrate-binding domain-containing protein [Alphaproteobacteria bacterium]
MNIQRLIITIFAGLCFFVNAVLAEDKFITIGATTSAYDSGLLPKIRTAYLKQTGVDLKLVIKGTGRVLDIARRGDLDALLVHDLASEQAFITDGFADARHELMYNDFVVVGPKSDPAQIRHSKIFDALDKIANTPALFASRGDNSGTHKAELRLWEAAGLTPTNFSAHWYKQLGSGMGATLNTSAALGAYTLSDRGTWLAFNNKQDMEVLVSDYPVLRNVYAFMVVSENKFPTTKAKLAHDFKDWLLGPKGQNLIDEFRLMEQQLFFPLRPKAQ